jgi:hypothetical protein
MGIRLFKIGKDVIDSFTKIVNEDTDIKNRITEAGGLISLLAISLELYERYKNGKQSPEEKAFASLMSFVFQTTNELLKDLKEKEGRETKFEYNWKIMQEEIFKPFEENSDWNSYLPGHRAVIEFKHKVIQYLKEQKCEKEKIRKFSARFDIKLTKRDDRLKEFYEYSSTVQQSKDLLTYLEYVEGLKNFSLVDRKPLSS